MSFPKSKISVDDEKLFVSYETEDDSDYILEDKPDITYNDPDEFEDEAIKTIRFIQTDEEDELGVSKLSSKAVWKLFEQIIDMENLSSLEDSDYIDSEEEDIDFSDENESSESFHLIRLESNGSLESYKAHRENTKSDGYLDGKDDKNEGGNNDISRTTNKSVLESGTRNEYYTKGIGHKKFSMYSSGTTDRKERATIHGNHNTLINEGVTTKKLDIKEKKVSVSKGDETVTGEGSLAQELKNQISREVQSQLLNHQRAFPTSAKSPVKKYTYWKVALIAITSFLIGGLSSIVGLAFLSAHQ